VELYLRFRTRLHGVVLKYMVGQGILMLFRAEYLHRMHDNFRIRFETLSKAASLNNPRIEFRIAFSSSYHHVQFSSLPF
jgi:hypothetical protein